jgi:hypothetical protein
MREKPLPRIRGRPTMKDRFNLYEATCKAATQVPTLESFPEMGEFGILAMCMSAADFLTKTQLNFVEPQKPDLVDATINNATTDYQKEKKAAINDQKILDWNTLQGAVDGLTENIRDALDKMYYAQLEDKVLGYKKVKITAYFDHLDKVWCKMDTSAKNEMRLKYFEPWAHGADHITVFSKTLEDEQEILKKLGVTISDEEKTEHFVKQMHASGQFSKEELMKWEKKDTADRTWDNAKTYFTDIVTDNDTYARTQGGTAAAMGFESAANTQEADLGDGLREYLASVASEKETAASTIEQLTAVLATNQQQLTSKDEKILSLTDDVREATANIRKLTDIVAKLTKKVESNSGGGGGGGGGRGGGGGSRRSTKRDGNGNPRVTDDEEDDRDDGGRDLPDFVKNMVNWGGYCHSCGFNPVGKKHTSATCNNKKNGHKDDATAKKRMGGSVANKPKNVQL